MRRENEVLGLARRNEAQHVVVGPHALAFEAAALCNKSKQRDLFHSKVSRSKSSLPFPFWGGSRMSWACFAAVSGALGVLRAMPML